MSKIKINTLTYAQAQRYRGLKAFFYVRDGAVFAYCGDDRLELELNADGGVVIGDFAATLATQHPQIAKELRTPQWPAKDVCLVGRLVTTSASTPGVYTLGFVYLVNGKQSAYVLHCGAINEPETTQ